MFGFMRVFGLVQGLRLLLTLPAVMYGCGFNSVLGLISGVVDDSGCSGKEG